MGAQPHRRVDVAPSEGRPPQACQHGDGTWETAVYKNFNTYIQESQVVTHDIPSGFSTVIAAAIAAYASTVLEGVTP